MTDVGALTGMPEMMDGRVKTLHPSIHGGLLALRDEPAHRDAMQAHGIAAIDCLVSNLYPFEATVARGAGAAETIENIDIGGPAMIRAAAKNAGWVAVVTDPADYEAIVVALREGGVPRALRARLAAKAFARTASYDAAVSTWYAGAIGDVLPERLTVAGRIRERLRYGENPHQSAALYLTSEAAPNVATARQVQGKELSYNNINDADAAFELVSDLPRGAAGRGDRQARQSLRRGGRRRSGGSLREGAPLRSGVGVWRHRRGEPAARREGGAGDHRHLHRGRRRAGGR